MTTVFLLSPARCDGERASMLVRSKSPLGHQLRSRDGAPLGDVFAWLSALYFRGKLGYSQRFGMPFIIAPGLGLQPPEARIVSADLEAMGRVDVARDNAAFVDPLRRDAALVGDSFRKAKFVLLGSVASAKYVEPLLAVFGPRLLFPSDFVGRGDMSRGGLLLRASRSGEELAYTAVAGAILHGKRPPRLPRLR
jgi:hypothetical protein